MARRAACLVARGPMDRCAKKLISNLKSRRKTAEAKQAQRLAIVSGRLQAVVSHWNARELTHGKMMEPNAGSYPYERLVLRAKHLDSGDHDYLEGRKPGLKRLSEGSNAWTPTGCIRIAFSFMCFGRSDHSV